MTNTCSNHFTIIGDPSDISDFYNKVLHPMIEQTQNSFTQVVSIRRHTRKGMMFRVITGWNPNYEWMKNVLDTYQSFWMKNEWYEEGGYAGVWVGQYRNGEQDISTIIWNDCCDEAYFDAFGSTAGQLVEGE